MTKMEWTKYIEYLKDMEQQEPHILQVGMSFDKIIMENCSSVATKSECMQTLRLNNSAPEYSSNTNACICSPKKKKNTHTYTTFMAVIFVRVQN